MEPLRVLELVRVTVFLYSSTAIVNKTLPNCSLAAGLANICYTFKGRCMPQRDGSGRMEKLSDPALMRGPLLLSTS
jgi:hypothetical protein